MYFLNKITKKRFPFLIISLKNKITIDNNKRKRKNPFFLPNSNFGTFSSVNHENLFRYKYTFNRCPLKIKSQLMIIKKEKIPFFPKIQTLKHFRPWTMKTYLDINTLLIVALPHRYVYIITIIIQFIIISNN